MSQNRVVNYAIPSEFRSEGVVCSEIIPPLRGFAYGFIIIFLKQPEFLNDSRKNRLSYNPKG